MLSIICGEDSVASRNYYAALKKQYQQKGYEVRTVPPQEILAIEQNTSSGSLFFDKTIYCTEHLEKLIIRKRGKKSKTAPTTKTSEDIVTELAKQQSIEILDWEEEKPSRDLKLKTVASVKEFKPDVSIFKLLDACYPGNLKSFVTQLNKVLETGDEFFVFTMLCRHIRSLLLASSNTFAPTVQSWQKYKLIDAAKQWDEDKLVAFYEGLARIDISTKTSTNPQGIKKSLEILSIFYL